MNRKWEKKTFSFEIRSAWRAAGQGQKVLFPKSKTPK